MEVKDEAIKHMKLLQLHPNVIKEFQDENKLNRSEFGLGIVYWLTDEEKQLVSNFENEHKGYLVYHVIKTITQDSEIVYDLLYVTEDTKDWIPDREYLQDNLVLSHTITRDSESGLIKIKKINGGLTRMC